MTERITSELNDLIQAGADEYDQETLDKLYEELNSGRTPKAEIQLKIIDPDSDAIFLSEPDEKSHRHMPTLKVDPKSNTTFSTILSEALQTLGLDLVQDHSTNPVAINHTRGAYQLVYEITTPASSISRPGYSWTKTVTA